MTSTMNDAIEWIVDQTAKTTKRKLVGENVVLAEIFELICSQHNLRYEMLLMIKNDGLIIKSNILGQEINLQGYTIDLKKISECPFEIIYIHSDLGYTIVSTHHINATYVLQSIISSVDTMVKIVNSSQAYSQHIFTCLDSLDTAISIYDVDGHLLYTNKILCSLFNIEDRNKVLGMHINDIMETCGITISSLNKNTAKLKMFDVLKTGKKEIGWEIIMESRIHSNLIRMAENDILPIFDKDGTIIGVMDIIRSYNQNFQRSKKFIALSANYTFNDIIHASNIMQDRIALAKMMAKNNDAILVTGESGVGKELFVQAIHNYSNRKSNPFVALNCASFPSELITSELFGYEAGAFTDASKKGHIGKFELANGGTLFLDEISELPYDSQSKLLRVLETRIITRIGGTKEIPVNVRIIAASNKDLPQMVASGLFRKDLYYRLQTLTLQIPPLRQRRADIPPLCRHFLLQCAQQNSCTPKKIRADAISALQDYEWLGNVRELKNIMTSITLLSKDKIITAKTIDEYFHLNENFSRNINDDAPEIRIASIKDKISENYSNLLNEALIICNGNKKKAAELIGVSRKTFYRMLEKYCR